MHQWAKIIHSDWLLSELIIHLYDIEYWTNEQADTINQFTQTYVFFFGINGQAIIQIDDQRHELNADCFLSCKSGSTYSLLKASPDFEACLMLVQVFEQTGLFKLIPKIDLDLPIPLASSHYTGKAIRIVQAWNSGLASERFRCQADFKALLLDMFSPQNECCVTKTSLSLEGVKAYIEGHFTESFTIEELASLSGLSSKYFSEVFKNRFGCTVMEFTSNLRLQEAKRLMKLGNLKVKQIAHRIGFTDEFYFSRKFKKDTGLSPTQYIKMLKQRIAAYSPEIIGQLLPLQIIPIAAPLHPKWTAYYYEKYRQEIAIHLSAYKVDIEQEANLMKLVDQEMELIIAPETISDNEKGQLEQYSNVFYISRDFNWKQSFLAIAKLTGKSDEAIGWMKSYEQEVIEIRKRLEKQKRNFRIIRMLGENIYDESLNPSFRVLLDDLKLTPSSQIDTKTSRPVTLHQLLEMNPDTLLLLIRNDTETKRNFKRLQSTALWKQLHAVKEGKILFIQSDPWLENSAYANLRKLRTLKALYQ